ncbi:MAG: GNAT family N-acetyltransferase [Sphingobacteriaceae bacterium]|nr:GNAT family N-acetyltransferase [Sphingobacteriaceae bacterium]
MPAVHALIHELATYEKAPEEHTCTLEQLTEDGFGPNPVFECLVAEMPDKSVVGMALFYTKYSTWKGKCIFLDDLMVHEPYRSLGIGKALLHELMRLARDRKAQRLEWQVLDWNEPAIGFYRALGAELDPTWINCKLTFKQLQDFRG